MANNENISQKALFIYSNRFIEIIAEILSIYIPFRESVSKEAELICRTVFDLEILTSDVL